MAYHLALYLLLLQVEKTKELIIPRLNPAGAEGVIQASVNLFLEYMYQAFPVEYP
jgi:hypothetical protein